jgi:hypothetical protein
MSRDVEDSTHGIPKFTVLRLDKRASSRKV